MEKLRAKLKNQGGFTLIEMLIVVAIIAILVVVSMPIVSGALEKARDATDQANERAAKAEALMVYMGAANHPTDNTYVAGKAITKLYYDAVNGKLVGSAPKAYGRCTGNGGDGTYTEEDHTKHVITVVVSATGDVTIDWEESTTT